MTYNILHPESKPAKPSVENPAEKNAREGVSTKLIAQVLAGQTNAQPGKTS